MMRGDQLMGTLGELGLHILNEGDVPTFDTIRGGKRYQSRVDVTFCTEDMLDLIDGWRVDEDLTSREILTIPWWSEKLAEMRKETNTMRRRIRNAAQDRRQHVVDEYLKQKENMSRKLERPKPGAGRSSVGSRIGKGCEWSPLDPEKSAKLLAETFYPEGEEEDNDEHAEIRRRAKISEGVHDEYVPSFTVNELKHALKSFNPKKAPGADGLTSDICTHAVDLDQKLFLGLINKCLEHRYFPKIWKAATVVILRKSGKDSYTERSRTGRLVFCLYWESLSLDIEGAFDSAWWPALEVRLAEEKCPEYLRRVISSYLSDRRVSVRYAGAEYERATSKGCVQGSIGGQFCGTCSSTH
uniref:Uncharacterized protein n=1 Tax=Bombyx mori TaxID=7091 RepID=A0A8R2M9Q3_BOMMO|nr:uncharacterized protein LOC119631162 [Bombyx mori]